MPKNFLDNLADCFIYNYYSFLLLNRQENKTFASDLNILYQSRFLTVLLAGNNNCST